MASSRHIEDVSFPGCAHPGILGTAPSHELLQKWNERERELIENGPDAAEAVNHETGEDEPPLALPPEPNGVHLGALEGEAEEEAAQEAARTIPPRENAGNCDIKNLGRGSRVYLPFLLKGRTSSQAICTSLRAMVRSRSVVPSRCQAGSISESTSSRTAWKNECRPPDVQAGIHGSRLLELRCF